MENHHEDTAPNETTEELSDDFQCCVCLDLLFKPVVLACGHILCFWCIFGSMDSWQESHCPICRHPFYHFPSICQLLHFMLLQLYPVTYRRREQQVTEEEKSSEFFSPQLDSHLSATDPSKELNIQDGISPHSFTCSFNQMSLGSCSTGEGESSTIEDLSESTVASHKDIELVQPKSRQVLVSDFLCAVCKELLYRPVVLNCGHVYCEACIISPNNGVPRCQICGSLHPNGYPKVCLALEQFLEKQFFKQYATRKMNLVKQVDAEHGSPACLPKPQKSDMRFPLHSSDGYLPFLSGQGAKVHFRFGCDYCGMCPIIGERYNCRDCREKAGFDLCGSCYNSSSKLPGRFNQQHKPEHKLEIVQPNVAANFWMLEPNMSEQDDTDTQENDEDFLPDSALEDQPGLFPSRKAEKTERTHLVRERPPRWITAESICRLSVTYERPRWIAVESIFRLRVT